MTQNLLETTPGKYRIGAVAKMTGVSVATLRVWQTRHRVVEPSMSEGGQRLYTDQEVKKLALIKGLNLAGHSMGSIAGLSVDQLQALVFKHHQLSASPAQRITNELSTQTSDQIEWPGAIEKKLYVAGVGLFARINTLRHSFALAQINLELQQEHDLAQLLKKLGNNTSLANAQASCYLIKINSTDANSLRDLKALREFLPKASIAVLYHYALAHELQGMRALGMEVKRETLSGEEMLDWLKNLLLKEPQAITQGTKNMSSPQRIFSNEALAYLSQIDNNVLCECPQHLAQILEQLTSFELYSLHCLSLSPKDEALHACLHRVAYTCRAMFEQSLLQIVQHEGLNMKVFDQTQSQ
jgi:DNA-binding transcriptional MerR regulator